MRSTKNKEIGLIYRNSFSLFSLESARSTRQGEGTGGFGGCMQGEVCP